MPSFNGITTTERSLLASFEPGGNAYLIVGLEPNQVPNIERVGYCWVMGQDQFNVSIETLITRFAIYTTFTEANLRQGLVGRYSALNVYAEFDSPGMTWFVYSE